VPTPSTDGGSSTARSVGRDLRDSRIFRVVLLAAVLLAAFAATKNCARQENKISQDEAVAIAKAHVDFTPDDFQIRYLPQGLPPVYYWAVSLYTVKDGNPVRVQVVLVNATTGAVRPS
jgi:Peptidase propeptide and YPEB domain